MLTHEKKSKQFRLFPLRVERLGVADEFSGRWVCLQSDTWVLREALQ